MASHTKPSPDIVRSRDAASNTHDRRTMTSTSSSNGRYSFGSSETGESSTASHKDGSSMSDRTRVGDGNGDGESNGKLEAQQVTAVKGGKGSHRNHRNRTSGGFLLSKSPFEHPPRNSSNSPEPEQIPRQRSSAHDRKGKATIRNTHADKRHTKTLSNAGTRARSSPLASNVRNASPGLEQTSEVEKHNWAEGDNNVEEKSAAPTLDVDSAQIVNLALNLNESRRIAARRNISTPLPPITQEFAEGFAGGSLRHHLQQQRRSSRNISPKPERGERGSSSSPRIPSGYRSNSPLQPAFEIPSESGYQYHFSQSTLARAEKAKKAIELMAEYRRVLQYLPPLKPQPQVERAPEESLTSPISPISAPSSRATSATFPTPRPLGRPYNPLQYIRNRKVRLRAGQTVNGEAKGFGNIDQVTSWVDQISKESSTEDFQASDCLFIPALPKPSEDPTSPHASPKSNISKGLRTRRPRNDWTTDPTDMLADILWLEQDDHKKLIEDSRGNRIFPSKVELKRPISRRGDDLSPQQIASSGYKAESPETNLRIDTKLPNFTSVKAETEKHSDSAASKAKQKLRHVRNAARGHHGHHSPVEHGVTKIRSRSRSDSSSESDRRPNKLSRRRRSGTTDSHDRHGAEILEKQMMEMLAKESQENDWNLSNDESQRTRYSSDLPKPPAVGRSESSKNGSAAHSRSGSIVNKERNGGINRFVSSGRPSLEVTGMSSRRSMEELDNTAPNSPETKASRAPLAFIPSIAMDLSPPVSRSISPTRTKAKHKISPFRDHSRDRSRQRLPFEEESPLSAHLRELVPDIPSSTEKRRRSLSPVKSAPRKSDEISKPSVKKNGSVRKAKGEDSGIKGLFKSSRNPLARAGDFIWKSAKEQLPGFSSAVSTDESDAEDVNTPQSKTQISHSRASSVGISDAEMTELLGRKGDASYSHDLPSFKSPFEGRGRPVKSRVDQSKSKSDPQSTETLPDSTLILKPPPTINVHGASPPTALPDGLVTRRLRDPSPSDVEFRRQSLATGTRLNEILGMPGHRRDGLPITGLANLEVSQQAHASIDNRRHWSISDREVSVQRGPMTKVEIARVRALLVGSGIKASEISRRAAELQNLRDSENPHYRGVAHLAPDNKTNLLIQRNKQHILAANLLTNDVQLSARMWKSTADNFSQKTVNELIGSIETLHGTLSQKLTPLTRKIGDEADEVSKDLVTSQTLLVKGLSDKIEVMMRRRRRRFRWLRRGGWVLVEWGLVGVMWWVWFLVVIARVVMGVGMGFVGVVRWLFWL
ncbi:hypothetical protein HYFRA_00006380 [Hymenoscyphus fraxineus]|uniref:Uncharacterized protein n=1 Tax=Hymenoscyphus fraxineus TaxID=746836 RepID=A0A9N9KQN8_9HELO|nr:hypothetical protein HYFRA_00006380 [Hymenoscyphus fraxineus]